MAKNYIIDTNIFLNDPNCIEILRNNNENNVFIPRRVLLELDGLKNDMKLNHLVSRAVKKISKHLENGDIQILEDRKEINHTDLQILNEIKNSTSVQDPILVTNDNIFRILASSENLKSEEYLSSLPFQSDSQIYTGFIENPDENLDDIKNFFTWKDGKPVFYKHNCEPKIIDYTNEAWGVKPKKKENSKEYDVYQNLMLELLLDDDIKLVSVQSKAGYGKTFLTLATALQQVFSKSTEKKYNQVIFLKPTIEVGAKLGFLPGSLEEKTDPYLEYILDLLNKLTINKACPKLFLDGSNKFNPRYFKFQPLGFIRGMNIDNAFVIIDESQNFSRIEMRSILTRMGENVKCVILGDTSQIDNTLLNEYNNGLNWVVRSLKSESIYAHLVLKGKKSRGIICDAVLNSGL